MQFLSLLFLLFLFLQVLVLAVVLSVDVLFHVEEVFLLVVVLPNPQPALLASPSLLTPNVPDQPQKGELFPLLLVLANVLMVMELPTD